MAPVKKRPALTQALLEKMIGLTFPADNSKP